MDLFLKTFMISITFAASSFCMAGTYSCLIEHKDSNPDKNKTIWSGMITPKGTIDRAAEVLLLKNDGNVLALDNLIDQSVKTNSSVDLKEKLKNYNGLLAISLKEEAGKLLLSLGHVDISNTNNMIPFDAMAWSSKAAGMIGVKDFKRDLEASCKIESKQETIGFKIQDLKKDNLYKQLDLKKGDIIQSYNDKPINSEDDIKGLYDALKTAPHVKLEVRRDGKLKVIEIDIKSATK